MKWLKNLIKKGADKIRIKIDLQKAYDRINRDFIVHMLAAMGVPEKLLKIIGHCLKSPTFSILINGVPKGYIQSTRGIRQGDPLSPYLFAIAMEWYTLQMELACQTKQITPVYNLEPHVTHLIYADDLLVVSKASELAIGKLKDIFVDLE